MISDLYDGIASIDLTALDPERILWCWCETEELLGTRGATFPGRCSSQATGGALDTRLHDWAQRQIVEFQRARRLHGISVFRLVRHVVWGDAGELRWCSTIPEEQGFERALRFIGCSKRTLIRLIYSALCDWLVEAAERDREL